jgi:hypothetical protein
MSSTLDRLGQTEPLTDAPASWPGPVSRRHRRRALLLLLGSWGLGGLLCATGEPRLTAVGVGLWLPGAGFLTSPHWFMVFPALALALWGLLRMIARGDHLTLPIGWLLSAVGAAWMARPGHTMHLHASSTTTAGPHHQWPVYVVPVLLTAWLLWIRTRRQRALDGALTPVPVQARSRVELAVPVGRELDMTDMGVVRWAIDHGLQEPDSWDGYEVSEQYTLKSLRYQLNWMQWALALAHGAATPAFSGVSTVAQRRLIERMTRPEVWSYWKRENLWGNLRLSSDPIAVDNIMFSGYLLAMLGSYRAATGDRHFATHGSLRFGTHSYDEAAVAAAVVRNFESSAYTLFPCEPGLVFPLCNAVALAGLSMTDAPACSRQWPEFHRQLVEEFTFTDGLIPFFSWTRGGASTYASRDEANTKVVGALLSTADVRFTDRMSQRLSARGTELPTAASAPRGRDWGTGKRSHVTDLAFSAMLAGATGDNVMQREAIVRADELLQLTDVDGVCAYEKASVTGNGMLAVARFSRDHGWQRLAEGIAIDGPRLEDTAYPAVLVHGAVTDGRALHLRLRAGGGASRQTLTLGGLIAGAAYRVNDGAPSFAAADGNASVSVDLDDTVSSITIAPED